MSALALGICVMLTMFGLVLLAPKKSDMGTPSLSERKQAEAGLGIVIVVAMVFAAYCAGRWL